MREKRRIEYLLFLNIKEFLEGSGGNCFVISIEIVRIFFRVYYGERRRVYVFFKVY